MKQFVELHESTEGIWYDEKSKAIILTPDDILTLKLLMDSYRTGWHFRNTEGGTGWHFRNTDSERILETLERILKQVG